MKKILTGIRPTGSLHLGHYFGMLQQTTALQNKHQVFLMLDDQQALTDNFAQPEKVRENILEIAKDSIACGIDPNRSTMFIQSMIPELGELSLYFSNLVSLSRLQQNPTVKTEFRQKQKVFGNNISYGFLGYPISQAADILAFEAELVPVGEDQRPMLELTRHIVRKFNALYGQTLHAPATMFMPRVRGLDGTEKMGKSLGNAIFLNNNPKTIATKINSAITDPKKLRLHDPGQPEICNVFAYHQMISKNETEIATECKTGTRGCVTCKKELSANLLEFLKPIQDKRTSLRNDEVMQVLHDGSAKARQVATNVLAKVKQAMRLDYGQKQHQPGAA